MPPPCDPEPALDNYSQPSEVPVVVADTGFDLITRLKECLTHENQAWVGDDMFDDLHDMSPLTTPESSPAPTPRLEPIGLPLPDPPSAVTGTVPDVSSEPTAAERRKRRKVLQGRENQKNKERKTKQSQRDGPPLRDKAQTKYASKAFPVYTDTPTADAPVASSGYVGLNRCAEAKESATPAELLNDAGLKLVEWDGRTTMLIIDREGRVVGILAGRPEDGDWETVQRDAQRHMEEARTRLTASYARGQHRRGAFATLRTGVSYGGGQTEPMNLLNTVRNSRILRDLNTSRCFRRIAGFGSSILQARAPELHRYYDERLGKLFDDNPSLEKPFNSIFTAATYNLGPQVVSVPHLDVANLPFGFCAITALGDYDPKKGGHLILWDCKLVIQFPPGATVLIPSAIITHSNVPVAAHEKRYSFTQYAAGALFRWVDNGFKTNQNLYKGMTEDQVGQVQLANQQRWKFGLGLLPHIPWVGKR